MTTHARRASQQRSSGASPRTSSEKLHRCDAARRSVCEPTSRCSPAEAHRLPSTVPRFSDAILPFVATWARELDLDIVLLRVSEPDPAHASHAVRSRDACHLEDLQRTVSDLQTTCRSVQPVILHHRRPAEAIGGSAAVIHMRCLRLRRTAARASDAFDGRQRRHRGDTRRSLPSTADTADRSRLTNDQLPADRSLPPSSVNRARTS